MLQGSLEDNTLTALCWNERLAPQIALKVKATDFSTDVYRRIAGSALDFLDRLHRPARAHIGDILEHEIKRGANGRFMQDVVEEMARLAPLLNEEHVLGELDKFLDIQRLILAEGARMATAGVAAGGLLALAGTRALGSLLFGVSPVDLPTLGAAAILLAAVAVAASYIPARSASRTDPMIALRAE